MEELTSIEKCLLSSIIHVVEKRKDILIKGGGLLPEIVEYFKKDLKSLSLIREKLGLRKQHDFTEFTQQESS